MEKEKNMESRETADIGIIGGSGFYDIDSLSDTEVLDIKTPFGDTSYHIVTGNFEGKKIAFLPRHGKNHSLNPSEVNYRANLYAMKKIGVKILISSTAVGSLKEEIHPTDIVIPDQYFDSTFKREKTFFEKGIVAHVSMANPVCPALTQTAKESALKIGLKTHMGGIYFNMEGPQFSSRGESNTYRKMGFSIIGMTQAIEAKLARELEMCFVPLAFVTDYDCWHPDHDSVSVEMVIDNLKKNRENAIRLISELLNNIDISVTDCTCRDSLKYSLVTDPLKLEKDVKERLFPLIKKYL